MALDRIILCSSKEKDKWLTERKKYITASEAAAVLRKNKYMSPRKLWNVKTGGVVELDNEHMRRGRENEGKVLKAARFQHYRPWDKLIASTKYPWLACTIDGIAVHKGNVVVMEAKAPAKRWESMPAYYKVQCLVQLLVTGHKTACLIEGIGPDYSRAKRYRIDIDTESELVYSILHATKKYHECLQQGYLTSEFW